LEAAHKKTIWVDLLCWGSALKIVKYARLMPIGKIRYVNAVGSFRRFIPWLERVAGAPCSCVDDVVESEIKLHGMSIYEVVQKRLADILDAWVEQKKIRNFADHFCALHGFNGEKFAAHLKEAAYPHIFRAVEISVVAEHLCGAERCVFIIRRTPFRKFFKSFLGVKDIHFYRTLFSHRLNIEPRKEYYFDRYLNPSYFRDRFSTVMRFFGHCVFNSLSALLDMRSWPQPSAGEVAIGLELTQNRQVRHAIHDLAWFEHSGIAPKQVRTLEFGTFDAESSAFIRSFGIPRYMVLQFPSQLFKRLSAMGRDRDVVSVTAHRSFCFKTFWRLSALARCLVVWNQGSWLRFQAAKFFCRTEFWRSVYARLGIRLVWTMLDVDEDKLAKAQAVELLGGLAAGGHWSNFPIYRVDNQKCLDVVMTWGEHFIKNNFQHSPFMAIFLVGYPCDYYFHMHKEGARAIRKRHDEKFILSYHDNIMANDIPYSKGMQLEIHEMLLSILKKFENVVVLLKPKRKFVMDEIFAALPELNHYLKEGRLEVFLGETPRTKAVPAQVGMASDLVIGLGISTTATEAYFAGAVAFHADLTGFEGNEFANRGRDAVVFRDIFTLENAVIERIQGKNKLSHQDYRGYYMSLDPFQDGASAKRIGFLLKRIREYLAQGMDRYVLLEKVKNDYDVYLSSLRSISKMSLN
jgi:hypothetical protein